MVCEKVRIFSGCPYFFHSLIPNSPANSITLPSIRINVWFISAWSGSFVGLLTRSSFHLCIWFDLFRYFHSGPIVLSCIALFILEDVTKVTLFDTSKKTFICSDGRWLKVLVACGSRTIKFQDSLAQGPWNSLHAFIAQREFHGATMFSFDVRFRILCMLWRDS